MVDLLSLFRISDLTNIVQPLVSFLSYSILKALVTFVIFYIFFKIVIFISLRFGKFLTRKTKTNLDDLLFDETKKPIAFALSTTAFYLAATQLTPSGLIERILIGIILTLITISLTLAIKRAIVIFIEGVGHRFAKKSKSSIDDELLPIITKTVVAIMWVIGFLVTLTVWGVDVGPFLASLGIAGLAISFALQDTLKNIFGGVSLIVDKNVKVGDWVSLDQVTVGEIHNIGLRSTKIKSWNNEIFIVPNGLLAAQVFKNLSLPDKRIRVVLPFGVEYGTKIDKVRTVLLSEIKKKKYVLQDPEPRILFTLMADSSLNFEARVWIADMTDMASLKDDLLQTIYDTLIKNKIGIPFPTRTLYMHNTKK